MKKPILSSGYYSFALRFLFYTLRFSLCALLFELCLLNTSFATIRYVSHSGSSTPPYTTWETAADSIQKCIDYSFAGDTIIVANGTYYESLIVDKYLSLIGSSMDSTIIDGTGLANATIFFEANGLLNNFYLKGKGHGIDQTSCLLINLSDVFVKNCRLVKALEGVTLVWSSSIISQCFIMDVSQGYSTYCDVDTCNPQIESTVILIDNSLYAGINIGSGKNIAYRNNIFGINNSYYGIGISFGSSENIIKSNMVSGFNRNLDGFASDTAIVYNNNSTYASERGYTINSKTDMRNNISTYNHTGVVGPTNTNSDYNLYWQNNTNTTGGLAEHDIIADPMFVNDTIPVYGGSYDYHLQAYSPAIDSGDPNILDVDGTRSDIGVYGGPLGQSYTYLDLPPRAPVNFSATLDSIYITLTWNKNTEADFSNYNIYRDTIGGFIIDSSTLVASIKDTFYIQAIPPGIENFYFRVTAVDNQANESEPSEELHLEIVSVKDRPKIFSSYELYQNYPNPFNPSTKIGYRLKERGYVKLMVYDIKGELVEVLVNKEQGKGYYEVEFGDQSSAVGNQLASGIYLYRIEVIGKGRIPRFSNMKKMILVK